MNRFQGLSHSQHSWRDSHRSPSPRDNPQTDLRQRFQELRISPALDLYLFPVHDDPFNTTTVATTVTTTTHWVLLLAPQTNTTTNTNTCTFLHIHKTRNTPHKATYTTPGPHLNLSLNSDPSIANGTLNLTQHKIGRVSSSQHDVVLRLAETTMVIASNKMLPWVMCFLLALEDTGLVAEGTRTYYDRFCGPFWPEIEEVLGGLGVGGRREELVRRLRGVMLQR